MVKFTIALLVLAVCALNIEAQVVDNRLMLLVRPKLRQCAADLNVPDSELERIINNDLTNQMPEVECLSLCFFKQLAMFDSDNRINLNVTTALFAIGAPRKRVEDVVGKCKGMRGGNDCQTAGRFYGCLVYLGLL